MIGWAIFWLSLAVALLVIEASTFNLITVWFSLGALAALIGAAFSLPPVLQFLMFVFVSAATLLLIRPLTRNWLRVKKTATNSDRVIGKQGVVTVAIDPVAGTGQVKVAGQTWSARSRDEQPIAEGTAVEIADITGVKVVVVPKNNT